MQHLPVSPVLAWLAVLGLLLAACGGGDETAETSTTTTMATGDEGAGASETTAAPFVRQDPQASLLSLAWDADETCTYEGPTELTAGPAELVFLNGSEVTAYVNFLFLTEGKTVQDAYERNEWPTTKHAPAWTRELGTWGPVPASKTVSWVRDLSPGEYFMVCARMEPVLAVWWGTGLTVEG